MSRAGAYRAEPGSVASAQVAVRIGIGTWVIAGITGSVVIVLNDGNVQHWIMTSIIGLASGILGLAFLRRKARGR